MDEEIAYEEIASIHRRVCVRENYQKVGTPGWIFGAILTPLVILGSSYILRKGTVNDAYIGGRSRSKWPRVVLIWRLLVAIYCLIVLGRVLSTLKYQCGWVRLNAFTVWNWIVVCIYFVLALSTSICEVFFRDKSFQKLHLALQVVAEIEIPSSLLVSAVVWGFLAPVSNWNSKLFEFDEASMHISNALTMVIDFIIASYSINPRHVVFPLIWGALYLSFHLVMNFTVGIMAYSFLITDSIIYIPACIILLLLYVGFFYAAYGISLLKNKCPCCLMIAVDINETA